MWSLLNRLPHTVANSQPVHLAWSPQRFIAIVCTAPRKIQYSSLTLSIYQLFAPCIIEFVSRRFWIAVINPFIFFQPENESGSPIMTRPGDAGVLSRPRRCFRSIVTPTDAATAIGSSILVNDRRFKVVRYVSTRASCCQHSLPLLLVKEIACIGGGLPATPVRNIQLCSRTRVTRGCLLGAG